MMRTTVPVAHIAALDGVRGVAVMAVVMLHAGVFPYGGAGVDLFFVLSGFLITGVLLDAKGAPDVLRPFYARRALRIFPLAFAVIAVVFLLYPAIGWVPPIPVQEQVWYWLYLSNWWVWPRSTGAWLLGHFWSLAVEEQFYLVWPWLALGCSKRTLTRVCLGLVVMAPVVRLAIALASLPPSIGHTYEGFTVVRCEGLAIGALLAIHRLDLRRWRQYGVLAFAIGTALYVPLILHGSRVAYVAGFTALAVATGGALFCVLTVVSPRTNAALRWSVLRWVGRVSYGLYVLHPLVIDALIRHGMRRGWPLFVVTAFVTAALAAVSWYGFERVILRQKRHFPMPRGEDREATSKLAVA